MPSYTAIIEVTGKPIDSDETDELIDKLSSYHPSISESPRRNPQITITLDAEKMAAASQAALAVVEDAIERVIVSHRIMMTTLFDKTSGSLDLPPLVSVAQAAEMLGRTPQAVQKRINSGALPATQVGRSWVIPAAAVESLADHDA